MSESKIILSSLAMNTSLVSVLEENNISLKYIKMMDICVCNHSEQINNQLLSDKSPLIVTSKYAALYIKDLNYEISEALRERPIYAIEGITSSILKDSKWILAGIGKNSKELVNMIIEFQPKVVTHLSTKLRLKSIEKSLSIHKIGYNIIEVYQKKMIPCTVKEDYHGIIFSSPLMAKSFLRSNHFDTSKPVFCIGQTTAKNLKKLGSENIIISERSSQESIAQSVIDYFSKKKLINLLEADGSFTN